jgi:hypothetical protein
MVQKCTKTCSKTCELRNDDIVSFMRSVVALRKRRLDSGRFKTVPFADSQA